jgi:aspartyl/asparaginyl-tRNA synthetase
MLIADIRRHIITIDHEGFFHHYLFQRPVQKVEVMGIITKIAKPRKRCIYHVDDGTGVIRCTQYFFEQPTSTVNNSGNGSNSVDAGTFNEDVTSATLQIGSLVRVKGSLERTEGDREEYGLALKIKMLDDCSRDRNMESVFKLEAIHLLNTMYNQPFP